MTCFVQRIQIVLVICIRQVIREIRHDGLNHSVGIQPGLVSLLSILRQEAVLRDHLSDLRQQVLTGVLVVNVSEPAIVVQTEIYRVQIIPVTAQQTAAGTNYVLRLIADV